MSWPAAMVVSAAQLQAKEGFEVSLEDHLRIVATIETMAIVEMRE